MISIPISIPNEDGCSSGSDDHERRADADDRKYTCVRVCICASEDRSITSTRMP